MLNNIAAANDINAIAEYDDSVQSQTAGEIRVGSGKFSFIKVSLPIPSSSTSNNIFSPSITVTVLDAMVSTDGYFSSLTHTYTSAFIGNFTPSNSITFSYVDIGPGSDASKHDLSLNSYIDFAQPQSTYSRSYSQVALADDQSGFVFVTQSAAGELQLRTVSLDLATVSAPQTVAVSFNTVFTSPYVTAKDGGGFNLFWTEKTVDGIITSGTVNVIELANDGTVIGSETELLTLTDGLANIAAATQLFNGAYVYTLKSGATYYQNSGAAVEIFSSTLTGNNSIQVTDAGFYVVRDGVLDAAFLNDGTTDASATNVLGMFVYGENRFVRSEFLGTTTEGTSIISYYELDIYDASGALIVDGAATYENTENNPEPGSRFSTNYALAGSIDGAGISLIWKYFSSNATFGGSGQSYVHLGETGTVSGDNTAQTLEAFLGGGTIFGYGGDDILIGSLGDDVLIGGEGDDIMRGNLGNDAYVVDSIGDVIEGETSTSGTDVVYTSVTYALADHLEIGVNTLLNTAAILIGNAGDNTLILSSGADGNRVDGLAGADIIYAQSNTIVYGGDGNDVITLQGAGNYGEGNAGNDSYIVIGADNTIVEYEGEGTDTAYFQVGTGVVSTLTLGENIENGVIIGSPSQAALYANASNNTLIGSSGSDIIAGFAGNDFIIGGAGNDILIGGTGLDTFQGHGGADIYIYNTTAEAGDIIQDFVTGEDGFIFAATSFGLTAGHELTDGTDFFIGGLTSPTSAGPTFIWDADGTALYFDVDGSGAADAILIADLQDFSSVTVADIDFV